MVVVYPVACQISKMELFAKLFNLFVFCSLLMQSFQPTKFAYVKFIFNTKLMKENQEKLEKG